IEGILPNSVTLVILMGYRKRETLAKILLERGYSPKTPVAVVSGATHMGQDAVRTELENLGSAEVEDDRAVTLVIGDVVALGEAIEAGLSTVPAEAALSANAPVAPTPTLLPSLHATGAVS
ncbi:MAG: hypothetical protein AAF658_18420, partial [Myxococcota bacterium]